MNVTGLIAEYNPFHKGHEYHLTQSKVLCKADYVIVVMSGNYVQRGMPAIVDKYTRAKMALACGADLVLELPVRYATSSARYFATGGISLLESLGVVTHLCFGSESGDSAPLQEIAHILSAEPKDYSVSLKKALKTGLSYPTAREYALTQYFHNIVKSVETKADGRNLTKEFAHTSKSDLPHNHLAELLSSPNNILGIEYCTAIEALHSHIVPMAIKRLDSAYHQETLSEVYSSATAIRKHLEQKNNSAHNFESLDFSDNISSSNGSDSSGCLSSSDSLDSLEIPDGLSLVSQIPSQAAAILAESIKKEGMVTLSDYSLLLKYQLMNETVASLTSHADLTPELAKRILNHLDACTDYESFLQLLKTKDITYARIARALLHVLLHIPDYTLRQLAPANTPYARILGFRRESTPLLKAIKSNSAIPLITKLADRHKILLPDALTLLEEDIYAANLYYTVQAQKNKQPFINEITRSPIIV